MVYRTLSSIFLFCIVHCTGCTEICLSQSRWLLCSHRHSTLLMNRPASVEAHGPFPMRHPAVLTRRQLCDILCLRVLQTRSQLCDVRCLRVRRRLCDVLFPRALRRLCNVLDFEPSTAFASSPSSRARLRVRAAEFGAESATPGPEFFSASALSRQELHH